MAASEKLFSPVRQKVSLNWGLDLKLKDIFGSQSAQGMGPAKAPNVQISFLGI
jgi:hypothetical protein